MSFLFGGGRPQPSSAEKIAAAEAEIDMVSDMYNRYAPRTIHQVAQLSHTDRLYSLVETCTKKCIPNSYREGDLNKGESVCLDRCVSKFFEVKTTHPQSRRTPQGESTARHPLPSEHAHTTARKKQREYKSREEQAWRFLPLCAHEQRCCTIFPIPKITSPLQKKPRMKDTNCTKVALNLL